MQAIHDLLMSMTAVLFAVAGIVAIHDIWHELEYRRSLARGMEAEAPATSRWKVSLALAAVAWIPLLVALAMVLFSNGRVAVRGVETESVQVRTVEQPQRLVAVKSARKTQVSSAELKTAGVRQ